MKTKEGQWVSMSADVKGDIYEGLLEKKLGKFRSAIQKIHPAYLTQIRKIC